ncbi:YihY family inner membrane protein [Pseudaquabacterium rugosum]|jgi:membrane protein|uniref:UPF0761 membrane protein AACH11_19055 n=1 Tax=Pseudaquabacterium rugosum TaxID=2984194 RepID=A0ABU9BGJ4_9BURK
MHSLAPVRAGWRGRLALGARVLRTWPWLNTLQTLRQRLREDRLSLTASSLTFTTLIGLVPMMTVVLALFTAFPVFGRFQVALQKYFLQALVPDTIARPVLNALTQFAGKASRMGGVGLVVLLITAVALVFTIDRTLNAIWRVPRPRPLAQRLLIYWAALTLGPLLLGGGLALTQIAISASRDVVDDLPGGLALLLALLEVALLSSGAALMFRFVPNTPVKAGHAWAGGLFVGIGLALAKRGLALYVKSVPTYSVVYGAFATLPILLLWIYLGWLIVLLGAVLAAYAPTLSLHVSRLSAHPGSRFTLAVELLQLLQAARRENGRGLRSTELAARTHIDPLQVDPLLEEMHALDWCARLDEDGEPRWVLLIEPRHTPAAPLLDALLLEPSAPTEGLRRAIGLPGLMLSDLLGEPGTGRGG